MITAASLSSAPVAERRELSADLALVGVTAIWGSTFVVNRLVLDAGPPLLFLTLRFALASLVLVALARGRKRTPLLVSDGAIIGLLLSLGIGFQMLGQVYTTASKAAFVTGLSVPLTPVAAWLMVRKRPSAENLAGLVVATVGFGVLTWPKEGLSVNRGDVLVLTTALTYAVIIVHMGESAGRHDARWYSAFQTAFAALGVGLGRVALTPFLGGKGAILLAEARPMPRAAGFLAAVLYMALVATVLSFVVQTWAQARMSATHAAVLFALEPVWTALFAALVLGERMGAREAAGAALVLAGILVSELPLGRR
jgi:drug/metabolite transporter (DMT)-like permease